MSGFGLDHLPYGVVAHQGRELVVVRLEDEVVDLAALDAAAPSFDPLLFAGPDLGPLLAAGPEVWSAVRSWLQDTLAELVGRSDPAGRGRAADAVRGGRLCRLLRLPQPCLQRRQDLPPRRRAAAAQLAPPAGRLSRPGRHGRPLGHPIVRPHGQRRPGPDGARAGVRAVAGASTSRPSSGSSSASPSTMGEPVPADAFADHVFGVSCSTTGPPATSRPGSTSRSARSSASRSPPRSHPGSPRSPPCRRPVAAARPRTPNRSTTSAVTEPAGYGIDLEVVINGSVVSRPPYASMYWSPAQMLAHMTVNGASCAPATSTAPARSPAPTATNADRLLELSWGGTDHSPSTTAPPAPTCRTATPSPSAPPPARSPSAKSKARSPPAEPQRRSSSSTSSARSGRCPHALCE